MWPAGYVYGRRNGILCHARCNSIIDAGERGWSFPVPPQLGRRTDTFPNFHRRPQLATTFSRLSIPSPSRCHPVMSGVSNAGGEYSYELLLPPLQAGAEEEGASARPKVRSETLCHQSFRGYKCLFLPPTIVKRGETFPRLKGLLLLPYLRSQCPPWRPRCPRWAW